SRPPIMLKRVDLPEPDGPISEIYSPRRISRSTSFNARRVWPPMVYSLARFLVRTIYSCVVATATVCSFQVLDLDAQGRRGRQLRGSDRGKDRGDHGQDQA